MTNEEIIQRQNEYIQELEGINLQRMASMQRLEEQAHERERELVAQAQELEAKVYQATDRAAASRESIVRLRERLGKVRQKLIDREAEIDRLETAREADRVFHNGYVEGLKDALRVALDSKPAVGNMPLTTAEARLLDQAFPFEPTACESQDHS